jgi:hypothetical protein
MIILNAVTADFDPPVFSNRRMSLEKSLDGGGGSSFQV